jgi:hypothetical protein
MFNNRNPAPALRRLLDDSLAFPPEYGAGLSSHLPMALAALDGLGADESRLRSYFAGYVGRFKGRTAPAAAAPLDDWPAQRGQLAMFAPLRASFAAALAGQGRDAMLREALPLLVSGVGAAAFHGVIRTAHAVESQHGGELAAALAYWAARWMALPAPDAAGPPIESVAGWLDAIDTSFLREGSDRHADPLLISDRMRALASTATYRGVAGRLHTAGRDPGVLLHELALAAAARYAATRNFTVLHMATGARAARVLAPWLPAGADALAPLWHAVAAASMASGVAHDLAVAAARTGSGGAAPDWTELRERACASDDEHVIKLVHAMVVQDAADPHPVWQGAAAAAVANGA